MKVALVNFTTREFNPYWVVKGLLYLGTILKKKGHDVILFQMTLSGLDYKDFIRKITKFRPDMIGISVTETNSVIDNIKGIKDLRKALPDSIIVVGGQHVTAVKEEVFEYFDCDFAFYSEADISFPEFVENYPRYKKIKGLIYKKNGKVIINPVPDFIDLDTLPFPDYSIIYNIKKLRRWIIPYLMFLGFNIISLDRGCPYNCDFCSISFMYQKYRKRKDIKKIVDEVEYNLKFFQVPYIHLYSDTLTYDWKWTKSILEEVINRDLRIKVLITTRIDLLDEEKVKLLKKAGCFVINVGIETASPRLLKSYNKRLKHESLAEYRKTAKILRKYGILLRSYLILGYHDESYRESLKTLSLIFKLKMIAFVQIFDAYPNTKIYNEFVEKKIIDPRWYTKYRYTNIPRTYIYSYFIFIIKELFNFLTLFRAWPELWNAGKLHFKIYFKKNSSAKDQRIP